MFTILPTPEDRYRELVLPHVSFLYRMAFQYARNSYDAEDLVQETCYLALKNLHQLRNEGQVKGWLARILRNAFLRTLRPSKRMHTEEWVGEEPGDVWRAEPEPITAGTNRRDLVQKLVDELQEHYKSALLLHTVAGLTYEQIAQVLDIPIGTVMSRISRAKRILRERLEKIEGPRSMLHVVPGGRKAGAPSESRS